MQSWTPDDGRRDRPKHIECCSKIKYISDIVHLVGFTIETCDVVIENTHFLRDLVNHKKTMKTLPLGLLGKTSGPNN
jgi:hypothetical protein